MRWLLICLVASVVALLLAAAGMARHIWRERAGSADRQNLNSGLFAPSDRRDISAGETDVEPEL